MRHRRTVNLQSVKFSKTIQTMFRSINGDVCSRGERNTIFLGSSFFPRRPL